MWDTAHGGAVWVPDHICQETIDAAEDPSQRAEELAREACRVYTDYCNGYCYCVHGEKFTKKKDDWIRIADESCGGYFSDDVKEALKEVMEGI